MEDFECHWSSNITSKALTVCVSSKGWDVSTGEVIGIVFGVITVTCVLVQIYQGCQSTRQSSNQGHGTILKLVALDVPS